jgi:hypothetical protein
MAYSNSANFKKSGVGKASEDPNAKTFILFDSKNAAVAPMPKPDGFPQYGVRRPQEGLLSFMIAIHSLLRGDAFGQLRASRSSPRCSCLEGQKGQKVFSLTGF